MLDKDPSGNSVSPYRITYYVLTDPVFMSPVRLDTVRMTAAQKISLISCGTISVHPFAIERGACLVQGVVALGVVTSR